MRAEDHMNKAFGWLLAFVGALGVVPVMADSYTDTIDLGWGRGNSE